MPEEACWAVGQVSRSSPPQVAGAVVALRVGWKRMGEAGRGGPLGFWLRVERALAPPQCYNFFPLCVCVLSGVTAAATAYTLDQSAWGAIAQWHLAAAVCGFLASYTLDLRRLM